MEPRRNSGFASPSSTIGQRVWATTFADILTLVLSFFIATIALSPLNPASESPESRQIPTVTQQTRGLAGETRADSAGGTPLADGSPERAVQRPVEVVELDEFDFSADGGRLAPTGADKLEKLVASGGYSGAAVRIESCARPSNSARALAVGHSLRRHVFDTVSRDTTARRPTVRLAVTDGNCRSIPELGLSGMARITIRRTKD
jgi:hypothetical protein